MQKVSALLCVTLLLVFILISHCEDSAQQSEPSFDGEKRAEYSHNAENHWSASPCKDRTNADAAAIYRVIQSTNLVFAISENSLELFNAAPLESQLVRDSVASTMLEMTMSFVTTEVFFEEYQKAVDRCIEKQWEEHFGGYFQQIVNNVVYGRMQAKVLLRILRNREAQLIQGNGEDGFDADEMDEESFFGLFDETGKYQPGTMLRDGYTKFKSVLSGGFRLVKAKFTQVLSTFSEANSLKELAKHIPNLKELLSKIFGIMRQLKNASTEAGFLKVFASIKDLASSGSSKFSQAFSSLLQWAKQKATRSGGHYNMYFHGFSFDIFDKKKSLSVSVSTSHLILFVIPKSTVKMPPIHINDNTQIMLLYNKGQVTLKLEHMYDKKSLSATSGSEKSGNADDDEEEEKDIDNDIETEEEEEEEEEVSY